MGLNYVSKEKVALFNSYIITEPVKITDLLENTLKRQDATIAAFQSSIARTSALAGLKGLVGLYEDTRAGMFIAFWVSNSLAGIKEEYQINYSAANRKGRIDLDGDKKAQERLNQTFTGFNDKDIRTLHGPDLRDLINRTGITR